MPTKKPLPQAKLKKKLSGTATSPGDDRFTDESTQEISGRADSKDIATPRRKRKRKSKGWTKFRNLSQEYSNWIIGAIGLAALSLIGYISWGAKIDISVIQNRLDNHDDQFISIDKKQEATDNKISEIQKSQQSLQVDNAILKERTGSTKGK